MKILGAQRWIFSDGRPTKNSRLRRAIFTVTIIAPQAQLLETAKSVGPEALFKQVVIFRQFDPLWSILGDS